MQRFHGDTLMADKKNDGKWSIEEAYICLHRQDGSLSSVACQQKQKDSVCLRMYLIIF